MPFTSGSRWKPVPNFRFRLRPGRRGRDRAGPGPGHEEEDTRGDHGWRGPAQARTARCIPRGRICKQKLLVHFRSCLFHKFPDRDINCIKPRHYPCCQVPKITKTR